MLLEERDEGNYRICARAMERRTGDGYPAATVVVNHLRDALFEPRETCGNDALARGHRWESSLPAIPLAMEMGRKMLKAERRRFAAGRC